ncbi:hypothetical protein B0A48_00901 [Cryoendolithus antarcticus]|uniref:Aspartyl aminopeptidase n=1 Tax=Cryoendolithus antarcticus TaxID=1507870 RepID=A0A1V8TRP4_9PEZI|nr:hypothetical protein B0A48_00901 [Cryoendolithus antarcticus]
MEYYKPSSPSPVTPSEPQSVALQGNLQLPYRGSQPIAQLVGNDETTKRLMNRVATGEATEAEHREFAAHVQQTRAQQVHEDQARAQEARMQFMRQRQQQVSMAQQQRQQQQMASHASPAGYAQQMQHMLGNTGGVSNGSSGASAASTEKAPEPTQTQPNHKLQDYQMQMMLLEQQNKKRLLMARQAQDETSSPGAMHNGSPAVDNMSLPMSSAPGGNHALQDYQIQLMLLEEQNKKRRAAAGLEPATSSVSPPDGNIALQNYQEQLMFLASKDKNPAFLVSRAEQDAIANGPSPARTQRPDLSQPKELPLHHRAIRVNAEKYAKPFCDFLTENPTVFHAVDAVKRQLAGEGFKELSERDKWNIGEGGKYFVERNGSSLIAFVVGENYEPGNGAAILAGHVDALTAKLKPVSEVPNKAGYLQLGVAPYAGAPNNTWWDRDLSIGGRVIVKNGDKIESRLVKLDWPIPRIPTLAPRFGAAAVGPFNPETQMTPIIGLEGTDARDLGEPFSKPSFIGTADNKVGSFISTQPPRLVRAIGSALGLKGSSVANIINWELELFDIQPATLLGLDKEFISAGRIDDKLCSWSAIQALIEADKSDTASSSIMKVVGLFDDEEIGSGLRQGARGNLLPSVLERAVGSLNGGIDAELIGRTYANSFLVSSDVTHAVNPNFLNAYLENHSPQLNVGLVVSADSNGHMTTDSVSTAVLQRCADKVGAKLQVFQIRNDSRSGGTVGPMLSSATGIRAIDAGIPQLSMHSIRATTGALDPGLGVLAFLGFLNGFESVDKEFE